MNLTPAASENDPVAAQYERWTYPPPDAELDAQALTAPHSRYKDFRELHSAYWPAEEYREDRDILVAGCGTMAAASYAFLYPKARILGIDVSRASLAHEESLKAKYSLANLSLHHCPVEQAATLQREFDFIVTHGVLHHLADPAAGLRELAKCLRPDGVIAIMVYAKHGRGGVYLLQEFFRLLGLGQEPADVEIVRHALSALGPLHPLQPYLQRATDLHADSGIVDTFLHPRDLPYSVRDCLDLVTAAGLAFQGWDENIFYHPEAAFAQFPRESPLRQKLDGLRAEELWQAMEVFDARMPGHFFFACRADRDPRKYRVQFEDEAFLEYVPQPRFTRWVPADSAAGRPVCIERPPLPKFGLSPLHAAVFQRIDGVRTARECLEALSFPGPRDAVEFGRMFFRLYWRIGYLHFRLP